MHKKRAARGRRKRNRHEKKEREKKRKKKKKKEKRKRQHTRQRMGESPDEGEKKGGYEKFCSGLFDQSGSLLLVFRTNRMVL